MTHKPMKHALVPVAAIRPNPHRNYKRNPIVPERVEMILESIKRTGFWENIVVRPHPDKPDFFQLAYGHARVEAVKRAKIAEVRIPVVPLSDYDMLVAMIDENETQQGALPQVAFENVEAAVELAERGFRGAGPDGTIKEFWDILTNDVAAATSFQSRYDKSSFVQARNAFFEGKGIGRAFIAAFLPSAAIREQVLSTVLGSHYGQQQEEATRKEAQAKQKEAEAKAAQATATKSKAEAARLRAEAAAAAVAAALEEEARKIGGRSVAPTILLAFDNTNQMTDFAHAIKRFGVAKDCHEEAMLLVKGKYTGAAMASQIREWWYERSGRAAEDRRRMAREAAFESFRKRTRGGNVDAYMADLFERVREMARDVEVANTAAPYYEHAYRREAGRKDCENLLEQLQALVRNLTGNPLPVAGNRNGGDRPEVPLLT
jgi:hypothetical protein